MIFLIDENLPASLGRVFEELGGSVECLHDSLKLRGKSDEAIFEYVVASGLQLSDFHNLIVIEPGSIRKRKLPGQ